MIQHLTKHGVKCGSRAPRLPALAARRDTRIRCPNSSTSEPTTTTGTTSPNTKTVESLDSLLGVTPEEQSVDAPSRPWWTIPPKQTAPPRRLAMSPGNHGKFLTDELFATELRIGAATQKGSAIDVPKVTPLISYLLAAASLATSSYGAFILATQGQEGGVEYFSGLAVSADALHGGAWWSPLTSLMLYSSAPEALLGAALLAVVAAESEAVLGYRSFLAAYALGGLTACEACLLLGGGTPVAAGILAAVAAAAAMGGFYIRNPKQQRSLRVGGFLAAGLAAAALLAAAETGEASAVGLDLGTSVLGPLVAALSGGWLGYTMGPKLEVVVELDIPEGSMVVPEDAQEVMVVVDQSTGYKKLLAGAVYAAALAAVSQAIAIGT